MKGIIIPNKLKGEITVPPSKSVAHRAIICAALASGKSIIKNVELSKDINATINGMRALGADFNIKGNEIEVYGLNFNKIDKIENIRIDCNESGSTLRFLTMLVPAITNQKAIFIGQGKLGARPMNCYFDIFDKQNILYKDQSNELLNLTIQGELKGGLFEIDGNISSQFITGLLFACPLLKEDSTIIIKNELLSIGYIDLTLDTLKQFGIIIENKQYKEFYIKGNQHYKNKDFFIEGDYSQAAFYCVANAIGNNIKLFGLKEDSLQGDKIIFKFVEQLLKAHKDEVIIINGENCPDIIPVLSVLASIRNGKTIIKNIERLKIKECDRFSAIFTEFNKLGANVIKGDNYLEFNGVDHFNGGKLNCFNDHRMAMTFAIASTISTKNVYLDNIECVNKSYPNFWEDFKSIGGKLIVEE